MSMLRKIEQEYGEPFEDVVSGFVDMGFSMRDTSLALGFNSEAALLYWLRKLDIDIQWPGSGSKRSKEKHAQQTPARVKNLKAMRDRRRQKYGFWYQGEFGTLTEHARRLGVNEGTATQRRHHHPDKGPDYWLSKLGHKKPPPRVNNRKHPWRKCYEKQNENRVI